MSKIKFGAEVYTWFMQGKGTAYANQLDHMIRVSAQAGFTGIEPLVLSITPDYWMGDLKDPIRLRDALQASGIELACFSLVCAWDQDTETAEERAAADYAIEALKLFPGAKLGTSPLPRGRHNLYERRLNLIRNLNRVSRRARDAGIPASFHPNSPPASMVRTREDYDVVLNSLDPSVTGWTPDVGHIARGGMNIIETLNRWAHLVDHIHFKDFSGDGPEPWARMGTGKLDFHAITEWLATRKFDGWIICEDEAPEAVGDPDGVTLQDGEWCRQNLFPIAGLA